MSKDSKVVGVRLDPSQYEEIEEYAEEEGFDSVPSFFRMAAGHEMSDEYGFLLGPDGTESGEDRIGEMSDQINSLEATVQSLSSQIDALAEEIREGTSRTDEDAMTAVYPVLPDTKNQALSVPQIADQANLDARSALRGLVELKSEKAANETETGDWYRA